MSGFFVQKKYKTLKRVNKSSLVVWFHIIGLTISLSYIKQTLLNGYEEIFNDELLLNVLLLYHASVNILSLTKLGQSGYRKKRMEICMNKY